nr:uncharacterized protein LOC115268392 [Aedes albopictus]
MSIEALPNELLVQIFNHLSWSRLSKKVSLVNRRWYHVVGMAPLASKATLNLCKTDRLQPANCGDYHIPLEVLQGSSREYSQFKISMHSMEAEQLVNGTFGAVLQYCHHRWNIQNLHLTMCYYQFCLFLQHHTNLLSNVIKVTIVVKDIPPSNGTIREDDYRSAFPFTLPMEKLHNMDFEHRQITNNYQSPPYALVLITPNLETISIRRCVMRNNVRLVLQHCPKLRSIFMFSRGPLRSSFVSDPLELENATPQQMPFLSRLKLINVPLQSTLEPMFNNLQTIYLAYVKIHPTSHTITCENLTELMIDSLILHEPLKLRVPQLKTLNCDVDVLKLLHLHDTSQADQLIINMCYPSEGRPMDTARLAGLFYFRRLFLKLGQCYCYDVVWLNFLWFHLLGIRELRIREKFPRDHLSRLQNVLEQFPQISQLQLQGTIIPNDFRFLPTSAKTIYIEDCSVVGSSVQFSPSVQRVRVRKLWSSNDLPGCDVDGIQLEPLGQFKPLHSTKVFRTNDGPRMAYSTREGCQSDETQD